jgi:SAP domain
MSASMLVSQPVPDSLLEKESFYFELKMMLTLLALILSTAFLLGLYCGHSRARNLSRFHDESTQTDFAQDQYDMLTVPELRTLCARRGLSLAGLKAELADERFAFGQYKGILYSEVVTKYSSYCDWALTQRNPSKHLLDFLAFLNINYFKEDDVWKRKRATSSTVVD